MKIIWIEKLEETQNYNLLRAKLKNWWGQETVSVIIKEKNMSGVKYFDTGDIVSVSLWDSFKVFLESDRTYFQP